MALKSLRDKLRKYVVELYKNKQDLCPNCHYQFSKKERNKIPITRMSEFACPSCKKILYRKANWIFWVYVIVWSVLCFLLGFTIFRKYSKVVTVICMLLAPVGAKRVITPRLPIFEV